MSTMYARDGLGCHEHELDVGLNDDLDSEQNSTLAREFHCEYQVHEPSCLDDGSSMNFFLSMWTIFSPHVLHSAAGMPIKAQYNSPAVFFHPGAGIRRSCHNPESGHCTPHHTAAFCSDSR
jgi:hypothetical protein